MRKVDNDIRIVAMNDEDIIEYETEDCRIVKFKEKYYLQINTITFGWVFALVRDNGLKAKEYNTYDEVMSDIYKWEKNNGIPSKIIFERRKN